MNTKITSAIEKITLNAATFSDVEVIPTLINFFYGNNGTGKSTIALALSGDGGLTWQQGKSSTDYNVLIYNQDFINANFRSYGNLKGVFTVGEQNIEIQNEIAVKSDRRAELIKITVEKAVAKEHKESARNNMLRSFHEDCWNKTKALREKFDATQSGFKRMAQFADRVLSIKEPIHHDLEALTTLYDTAFDPNATAYRELQPVSCTAKLNDVYGLVLLEKSITSSSNTPFSEFIKAINATDWVYHGHEQFAEAAAGKCPYCQQKLPDGFEKKIATFFDKQYQEDINSLQQFQSAYTTSTQGFLNILKANLQDIFPKLDISEYTNKLILLEKSNEINLQRIADKLKEPSSLVTLENITTLLDEINAIITEFNKHIQANNAIVSAKKQKQAECWTKVWDLIAFALQNEVTAYRINKKTLDDEITTLLQQINEGNNALRDLESDIVALNQRIISTTPTIRSINDMLHDSGFQGFILREKYGQQNAYEVVRHNGQVVTNLSEGERNFITFLYFYHLVRGSHNNSDISKDKIVIIDDPVTSMDSSAMFIVSTLVREMVEVCYNNFSYLDNQVQGDYIKQIFILTHNVYFHKEITQNQVHRYNCVSFFLVNKVNNNSAVRLCVQDNVKIPTEKENYNPIQNSYMALWHEYREAETAIPLLNVIRRILEYYFIQLCGYDGTNLRKRVLEDNKDKFVETPANGLPDYTKYHLASAMLSYIRSNTIGVSDGLNYIDDCTDASLYKTVFMMIFEALQQDQHYVMMMNEIE